MSCAYRKVEAHDDEGQHELVGNAGPQELVVHDVAPHAVLQPASHAQTPVLAGSSSGAAPLLRHTSMRAVRSFASVLATDDHTGRMPVAELNACFSAKVQGCS